MKILLVFTLALVSVSSFAKTKAEKAEEAEWKAAKEACISKDSSLKGKKLEKCTKEEMKAEENKETKSVEKGEKEKK